MATVELRPHQLEALRKIKNGCIVKGGVGSGKSITSLAYYMANEAPRDIYVITTAKKRDSLDWNREAARFALGRTPDTTVAGVLTVDSWNNISNYKEIKDAFFIFDEQRLVGSGAWVKAFYKIARANRWIMLSATPGDVWLDYVPVFVANGFYKNRTEFIRRHVVYNNHAKFPKIDRYVETGRLQRLRLSLVVDMPYEKHTVRHTRIKPVKYNKELFDKVVKERWHIFEDRPIRDISELFVVMRKLVNSDVSRVETLMQLSAEHPKLIVFYNFNYELDILIKTCEKMGVPWSQWNGHKHQDIPDTDRWIYLVQYTAGAEGWECTETDTVVFWSLNYSYRIFEQCCGRIDRLNTSFKDLYYYILRSSAQIDNAIWMAVKRKESFSESRYSSSEGW